VLLGELGVLPADYLGRYSSAIPRPAKADAVITWHDEQGFAHALSTHLKHVRYSEWSWRKFRRIPPTEYPDVKDMASRVLGYRITDGRTELERAPGQIRRV
jgi:hypothetical protein